MKNIVILCIVLLLGVFSGMAQGIKFEQAEWSKLLAKAQEDNKLIFVDCYTSWCGPCKRLASDVFTNKEVGDFFNGHFINTKFDMEVGEGVQLAEKYGVKAFPTLLYINAKGEVVHRTVGGMPAKVLLEQGILAMDPEKNFSALQKRYEGGERSPEFLACYMDALGKAYLPDLKNKVAEEYLSALPMKQLLTKEKWPLLKENIKDPMAPAFQRLVFGRYEMNKVVGIEVENHIYLMLKDRIHKLKDAELDSAYYCRFVDFLQRVSYERAPLFLAQLYAMNYGKAGKYQEMVEVIKDLFRYNLAPSFERSECMADFLNCLQNCQDEKLVSDVCQWVRQVEEGIKDPIQQVALKDLQYNLLVTHNKKEEAGRIKAVADEIAKKFSEQYKRELQRQLVES